MPVTRSFDVFFDLRLKKLWANNSDAGDLGCHRAQYDVTVMQRWPIVINPPQDQHNVQQQICQYSDITMQRNALDALACMIDAIFVILTQVNNCTLL